MKRVLAAIMMLCVCVVPQAIAQTTARLPGGHWSFTLPANWKLVDETTLERVNRETAGVKIVGVNGPIQYVMMAASQEGDGCFMLVQWSASPPPNGTFDNYAKGVTKGVGQGVDAVKGSVGDRLSDLAVSDPEVDRQRERVYLTGQVTAPGAGAVKYLTCPILGSGETITLHIYAPAASYEQHRAAFRQIADSFAFDPGAEYKFAKAQGFDFGQIGLATLLGALAGGGVWTARKLTGRK